MNVLNCIKLYWIYEINIENEPGLHLLQDMQLGQFRRSTTPLINYKKVYQMINISITVK